TLQGHTDTVLHVAFSSDGRRLATGSFDHTAKVWDATTGQLLLTLQHQDLVGIVAFSPDGQRLASPSKDQTVKIWDVATERRGTLTVPISTIRGHFWRAVIFSPDGRYLAVATRDNTVRVFDAATGAELLDPLRGHNGLVHNLAYSPDGRRLATASADQTV